MTLIGRITKVNDDLSYEFEVLDDKVYDILRTWLPFNWKLIVEEEVS